MHLRIDTQSLGFLIPVRINFQITDFNNTVCVDIGSGRLKIEKDDGIFQI